jgi:hypothetical protein
MYLFLGINLDVIELAWVPEFSYILSMDYSISVLLMDYVFKILTRASLLVGCDQF